MAQKLAKLIKISIIIIACLFLAAVGADIYVATADNGRIYDRADDLPPAQAVLVLGAAVYRNGAMSDVFTDRANVALEVYRAGKADKILVSGDHSRGDYDEVDIGKKFLVRNGVPAKDIFVDYAGFDTYSSLYRAKEIFQVKSMIVSTQDFHLPRALFIARSLGLEACGIKADRREYNLGLKNVVRENAARVKAFWDVATSAQPRFLGDPIPITGDGRDSWE